MKYARKSAPARKYPKRRYNGARKKSSKPSKSFVKKVQKIIHKDTETKQAYHQQALTTFNSTISSDTEILKVIPSITNGANGNERVGEEIRAQKITVKGHMVLAIPTFNVSSNTRIAVRMFMVAPKYAQNYALGVYVGTSWLQTLLRKGGATTAFTGIVSDLYAPVNTEAITCYYDKTFYLSVSNWNQATAVGGTTQDVRQTIKFFSKTFNLRNKLLRYDDTLDPLSPMNFNPCILFGYVHLDGSSPDVLTTAVSMAYDSTLFFEDA
nr:MAG: capsid protein [Cressdnaviricota sp.]